MADETFLTIENGVVTKCDENAVDVVIPEGVTEIGSCAFEECSSLASVSLPKTIELIDEEAFYGCHLLSKITYSGTAAQWEHVDLRSEWRMEVPAKYAHCADSTAYLYDDAELY